MHCLSCNQYFKPSMFASSNICEDCDGLVDDLSYLEDDREVELGILCNPSGRTKAMIEEDRDEGFWY